MNLYKLTNGTVKWMNIRRNNSVLQYLMPAMEWNALMVARVNSIRKILDSAAPALVSASLVIQAKIASRVRFCWSCWKFRSEIRPKNAFYEKPPQFGLRGKKRMKKKDWPGENSWKDVWSKGKVVITHEIDERVVTINKDISLRFLVNLNELIYVCITFPVCWSWKKPKFRSRNRFLRIFSLPIQLKMLP